MHVRPIRQYCPLIFALILAVLVPATIVAQTNTTRLSGIVTDPTGALIPEVAVELSKPDIGFVKVVKSDSGGAYSFDQVTPGSYTVTVSAAAFSPEVEKVELLVATPRILELQAEGRNYGGRERRDNAGAVELHRRDSGQGLRQCAGPESALPGEQCDLPALASAGCSGNR
jgi:hypothetical protein